MQFLGTCVPRCTTTKRTKTDQKGNTMAKNSSKRIISPTGRLAFQSLFTASVNNMNPNAPAKFETLIVFDKDEDISALEEIVAEAIAAKFGSDVPAGLYMPIRDSEKKAKHGEPFASGGKFIKVAAKFQPGIVDSKLQPVNDESEI